MEETNIRIWPIRKKREVADDYSDSRCSNDRRFREWNSRFTRLTLEILLSGPRVVYWTISIVRHQEYPSLQLPEESVYRQHSSWLLSFIFRDCKCLGLLLKYLFASRRRVLSKSSSKFFSSLRNQSTPTTCYPNDVLWQSAAVYIPVP